MIKLINKEKLGISRALLKLVNEVDQKKLKTNGMLSRNSLCKERRSSICKLLFKLRLHLIIKRV